MKNKKIITTAALIITILIGIILLIFKTSNIYIRVNTNGGFITSGKDLTYKINPKFKIKFKTKDNKYKTKKDNNDTELNQSLKEIKTIDNETFMGEYNNINDLIYKLNNYIFYYKENDYNHFYRYNTKTFEIEQLEFSKFAEYVGKDNIGMSNFAVSTDIKTEAILNLYPNITEKLNNNSYGFVYYDNNKVFFEKNRIIYEYNIKNNNTKKIAKIKNSLTIKDIYVK